MKDPDRLVWPPTRSDVFAVVALGVLVYAGIEREWTIVAVALLAGLFAVVFPRMTGPFELGGDKLRFRGQLVSPRAASEPERVPETAAQVPEPQQDPRGSIESAVD